MIAQQNKILRYGRLKIYATFSRGRSKAWGLRFRFCFRLYVGPILNSWYVVWDYGVGNRLHRQVEEGGNRSVSASWKFHGRQD